MVARRRQPWAKRKRFPKAVPEKNENRNVPQLRSVFGCRKINSSAPRPTRRLSRAQKCNAIAQNIHAARSRVGVRGSSREAAAGSRSIVRPFKTKWPRSAAACGPHLARSIANSSTRSAARKPDALYVGSRARASRRSSADAGLRPASDSASCWSSVESSHNTSSGSRRRCC